MKTIYRAVPKVGKEEQDLKPSWGLELLEMWGGGGEDEEANGQASKGVKFIFLL